jgi:hypothetical protein
MYSAQADGFQVHLHIDCSDLIKILYDMFQPHSRIAMHYFNRYYILCIGSGNP